MPDNQDRGDKGGYPGGSYDRRLSLIYIIIGIALVIAGIFRGEAVTVFNKATRICMECIGIG